MASSAKSSSRTLETSVADVALSQGYDSVSAFITKFRRHLGTTPARYFEAQREA